MKNKHWPTTRALAAWTASAASTTLLLVACGGGGGGGSGGIAATPEPAPEAVPEAALSISGTAATGAALANRPVDVKCAKGVNTITTDATGRYTIAVAGGTLPCLLKVTAPDNSTLHSVATGTGTTAVSNITPATQLIVARLGASDPAAYFTAFDANAAQFVTRSAVANAQKAVVAALTTLGVNMSALGDLVTGTLTPPVGGAAGNAYDQALDALKTKLVGGTTLATLAAAQVAQAPAPGSAVLLPDNLLDAAAATHCPALRSATYRVIVPIPRTPFANQTETFTLNASNLTTVDADGGTTTLVPVQNSPCRFTFNSGRDELVVSQAGVIVARGTNDNGATYRARIAFPVQSHTLADLAGIWNTIGTQVTGVAGVFVAAANTTTVNDVGTLTGQTLGCFNETTWSVQGADCSNMTPSVKFAAHADGGFEMRDVTTNEIGGRVYGYRTGGGELMGVIVGADVTFITKQRTLTLPPIGRVTTNVGPGINASMLAPNAFGNGNQQTILSQNAAAGSYVRTAKTIGGTDDHSQTLTNNSPRNGYVMRTAATAVPTISGGTVNVSEFTALPMRGTGLSAVVLPANKTLVLSVDLP